MSRLRIGLITREWPTSRGDSGGIGTYFRNLALGLSRCGAEPLVLTGPPEQAESDQSQCQLPVIHLPEPKLSLTRRVCQRFSGESFSYQAAIYNATLRRRVALSRHLPGLTAEHGIEVLLGPLWAGELADAAGRTNLPLVVRASANMRQIVRANNDPPGKYDRQIHKLEQRVLLACSAFYAPSHRALGDLLACMIVPGVPRAVIPSGVDSELFKPAPDPPQRSFCRFLFVGRLEPQKGMKLLATVLPDVLSRVAQAEAWFVGRDTSTAPGGITWQEHLHLTCPEHVFRRCGFFGRLPWPRLPDLYRQCDLMLVPSVQDNLPNAALEAMASGLPVVASSRTGLEEIIRPEKNGLILDRNQPAAWTEALAALAADLPRVRHLGVWARSTVEAELSLRATTEPVIELCRRAMQPDQAHAVTVESCAEGRPL